MFVNVGVFGVNVWVGVNVGVRVGVMVFGTEVLVAVFVAIAPVESVAYSEKRKALLVEVVEKVVGISPKV